MSTYSEPKPPLFRPDPDEVYAFKTCNARVWPHPLKRVVPELRISKRYQVRFGAAHVIALVHLEIGATRRMDGWDANWYEGEVLRRLRALLLADPAYEAAFRDAEHRRTFESSFDWVLNTYQNESVDLYVVDTIGRRRYYRILLAVLRSVLDDEGLEGEITRHVLQRYRLGSAEWRSGGRHG